MLNTPRILRISKSLKAMCLPITLLFIGIISYGQNNNVPDQYFDDFFGHERAVDEEDHECSGDRWRAAAGTTSDHAAKQNVVIR